MREAHIVRKVKSMNKRKKPSWKELTIFEKIGVILFYILGIGVAIGIVILAYLSSPLFW